MRPNLSTIVVVLSALTIGWVVQSATQSHVADAASDPAVVWQYFSPDQQSALPVAEREPTLIHGIPETDASDAIMRCSLGSGVVELAFQASRSRISLQQVLPVQVFVDAWQTVLTAKPAAADIAAGEAVPSITLSVNAPIWQKMKTAGQMRVLIGQNNETIIISLRGLGIYLPVFLQACGQTSISKPVNNPALMAPPPGMQPPPEGPGSFAPPQVIEDLSQGLIPPMEQPALMAPPPGMQLPPEGPGSFAPPQVIEDLSQGLIPPMEQPALMAPPSGLQPPPEGPGSFAPPQVIEDLSQGLIPPMEQPALMAPPSGLQPPPEGPGSFAPPQVIEDLSQGLTPPMEQPALLAPPPIQPGVQPPPPDVADAGNSSLRGLIGLKTGRTGTCRHKTADTRKQKWVLHSGSDSSTAAVSDCADCEIGLALSCNRVARSMELFVPWAAVGNGQENAPTTFDICIDSSSVEYHGTTELQGAIGYLPKMKLWPGHELLEKLTSGGKVQVTYQGRSTDFSLRSSRKAIEGVAKACGWQ